MTKLKQFLQNWTPNNQLAVLLLNCVACSSLISSPDPRSEWSADFFNKRSKEARLLYLQSGGVKLLRLGATAKVDDLVDEVLERAKKAETKSDKKKLAYALIAINQTPHTNRNVFDQSAKLAEDIISLNQADVDGYEVYYHLMGKDSLPILKRALENGNSYTRIQAASRIGHNIGTKSEILVLEDALENESSETVIRYMREAIGAIEERESQKKDDGKVDQRAPNPPNGKASKKQVETPEKDGNKKTTNFGVVGAIGGLILVSVSLAASKLKKVM